MKAGRQLLAFYLRKRREELVLTQLDISRRMGLGSHMMISLMERSMCPIPPKQVAAIARAYEIDEANFYLWYNVARWVDEAVPEPVIIHLLGLPPDEPERAPDSPDAPDSAGSPERPRIERKIDAFLRRLLRKARYCRNGRGKKTRKLIARTIHSLWPLLLIRSKVERMNFHSRRFDSSGYANPMSSFGLGSLQEISFSQVTA